MSEETKAVGFNWANLFTSVEKWHGAADPAARMVDALLEYLAQNDQPLPFTAGTGDLQDYVCRMNVKLLVNYLCIRKLDFVLSPLSVDAFLKPVRMYELEEYGYNFFLDFYREHNSLGELIRKSIAGPLQLRVQPVYPADGEIMAWLFDPRDMKVLAFCRREMENPEPPPGGKMLSIGRTSTLEDWTGTDFVTNNHPFSEKYKSKIQTAQKHLEELSASQPSV